MIFKDRREAGIRLLLKLLQDRFVKKYLDKIFVVSLLRGGAVVGDVIAKGLEIRHLPLAVCKIPAPHNPELALGAVCFDITYLDKNVISNLHLENKAIIGQTEIARKKFNSYLKRFQLSEYDYSKNLKNKIVILTDDGIATGSTIKAAVLYLKSLKPKFLILAIPVAPSDFSTTGINKTIILHKNFDFGAISQFYERFPQVDDKEVVKLTG